MCAKGRGLGISSPGATPDWRLAAGLVFVEDGVSPASLSCGRDSSGGRFDIEFSETLQCRCCGPWESCCASLQ